MQAKNKGFVT